MNDDILGNNIFVYCGNNPVIRIDSAGKGWLFVLACATFSGVVSTGLNAIGNLANGGEWYYGAIGSFVGGGVSTLVTFTSSNVVLASYAGSAVSSIINEGIAYTSLSHLSGTNRKDVTLNNLTNSICTIIESSAVEGSLSVLTGKFADKLIPVNTKSWIQPQKIKSVLTGNYARKMYSAISLDSSLSFVTKIITKFLKKSQKQTVSFSAKPFVGVGGSLYGN